MNLSKEDLYNTIYMAVRQALADKIEESVHDAIIRAKKDFLKLVWLILLVIVGVPIAIFLVVMFD